MPKLTASFIIKYSSCSFSSLVFSFFHMRQNLIKWSWKNRKKVGVLLLYWYLHAFSSPFPDRGPRRKLAFTIKKIYIFVFDYSVMKRRRITFSMNWVFSSIRKVLVAFSIFRLHCFFCWIGWKIDRIQNKNNIIFALLLAQRRVFVALFLCPLFLWTDFLRIVLEVAKAV